MIRMFGTILGYLDGVAIYSNVKSSVSNKVFSSYGVPYQCVEFARRWLVQSKGYTFSSVPNAIDMWKLQHVTSVHDGSTLPIRAIPNGGIIPQYGNFLIWKNEGEYQPTGHVAVIMSVEHDHVDIAEQNINNTWTGYSRRLPLRVNDGQCTIDDPTGAIEGWLCCDLKNERSRW
jgi:glutathionylspermidine amidase/synthetase